MKTRRSWIPFVAMAVLALIVLLVTASRGVVQRTFALGSPNQTPVAVLSRSQQACEGPVVSQGPSQAVGIWGAAVTGPTVVAVNVEDAATRRPLASGGLVAMLTPDEYQARLARTVPAGRPLEVCVIDLGANSFSLLGSAPIHPGIVMAGSKPGLEFSLIMLNETRDSLLGSLGEAFSRASLFRPSWVGTWTFWVLAFALLGTIVLGAFAIEAASSADDDEQRRA